MYSQTSFTKRLSPPGSHIIPVFAHRMLWQLFDGAGTPLTTASNVQGYAKIAIFEQYLALSRK